MSFPRERLPLTIGVMAALWNAPAAMATPAPGPVEGRSLAVGDVSFDGYPDVYLLTGGSGNRTVPNPPDTMLIDDGGTAFHPVPIPETSKGWGGWVEPVDYDGTGTTDFVVANGANDVAGPIQLISFARPASRALPDQTDIGRRDAALTQHEGAP